MENNNHRHKPTGRSKIEIKYIEDDKKRQDTLYKRRRGIIKKVHELGVICGLKISLMATDFTNMCFTYSNDERVNPHLPHIFKKIRKPIWWTDFSSLEYPFKSVKKENRIKLLQGHQIDRNETDYEQLLNNSDFLEGGLECMGKRLLPEKESGPATAGADFCQNEADLRSMNNQLSERSKLLKIEKLETTHITHFEHLKQEASQISLSSAPGSHEGPENQRKKLSKSFINFGEINLDKLIKPEELDDFLTFSVGTIIREIKQNPPDVQRLTDIDPDFFEHLVEANRTLLHRMGTEKYYVDLLVFRHMLCMYFSSHDFIPFKFSKKIPEKAVIDLLTKIDKIDIQKTCEVFLRVIFDKITPTETFSFEEEFKKIRFCSKLYSMKKVHIKRFLISTFYSSTAKRSNLQSLIEKGKLNLKKTENNSSEEESAKNTEKKPPFGKTFSLKYRGNLLVVQDSFLTMTCNEMIGLFSITLMSGTFFSSLPEEESKQVSIIVAKKDFTKMHVVKDLMNMERERNQVMMEKRFLDMKSKRDDSSSQVGSSAGLSSVGSGSGLFRVGGDVGGGSTCSDFSFNLVGSRSMAFNFFNF